MKCSNLITFLALDKGQIYILLKVSPDINEDSNSLKLRTLFPEY